MQWSISWKTDRSVAGEGLPHILWYPMFHYTVHGSLLLVSTSSRMNPVHALPYSFFKIHFSIIPSTHIPSKRSVTLRFSHQNPLCTSPPPITCYMYYPSYPPWFHHANSIERVQIVNLLDMQSSPVSSYFLSFTLKCLPLHAVLHHPHPIFTPQCERPRFRPVWNLSI